MWTELKADGIAMIDMESGISRRVQCPQSVTVRRQRKLYFRLDLCICAKWYYYAASDLTVQKAIERVAYDIPEIRFGN